jgi:hypothetical protein
VAVGLDDWFFFTVFDHLHCIMCFGFCLLGLVFCVSAYRLLCI